MFGVIGFILSLVVLILFAYKGWHIILVAIIAALVAGLFSGINLWTLLSDGFMPGMVSFIQSWFLVFTLGSIFSEFLSRSGSVASIAYKMLDVFGTKNTTLVISVISVILTMGGVNPYVQIFLIWPICIVFSRETRIPRGIWIAAWYLGMFAPYNIPGNPTMANVIYVQNLGISAASQPIFSLILFAIYFISTSLFFKWRVNRWRAKGMEYTESEADKKFTVQARDEHYPGFFKAVLPMIAVIAVFILLTSNIAFLPSLSAVNAIYVGMVFGTVLCLLMNFKVLKNQLKDMIMNSVTGGVNPVITAGVVTGYLYVLMMTSTYQNMVTSILNIDAGPYLQVFIAANVMTFLAGSGVTAAQPILDTFQVSWIAAGANPGVLRSVMSANSAAVSLSPHCGGMQGVFGYTGSNMKESYGSILFGTLAFSVLTGFIASIIATVIW